ncbi:peptidase, partial [Escherichia coli]
MTELVFIDDDYNHVVIMSDVVQRLYLYRQLHHAST